ncbi:MAG: IPT/TIG domain-containing protein [Patescibacteria group bacterium]
MARFSAKHFLLAAVVLFLLPRITLANDPVFTRTLRIGDFGADVQLLQQKLNTDSETRVAEDGPGSPGQETALFGMRTQAAVIRFQEKNAEKILAPLGLSSGTGVVGEATRRVLNEVFAQTKTPVLTTPVTNTAPAPTTSATTPVEKTDLYITFPSSYYGPRGSKLTLAGNGFTKTGNTLYLGPNFSISNIPSSGGASLTATIPNDAPYGKHVIWVENANGKTLNTSFYVVTKEGSAPPTITSVSPESGLYGQQVTVHGKNFAPKGNEILTNYHIIKEVPSPDGTTLTFSVAPFPEIPQLQVGVDLKRGIEAAMTFYVVNENGVSNKEKPGKFTIKI